MRADEEGACGWDGQLLNVRELFASGTRRHWENECRRLTFNARLSGDDVLCRVLGRYTFVVDGADVGLAPHLIADGFWEIWVTRLIAAQVQEGMVCFDAGANVGYYAALMADLAGLSGRLIAVEPVPSTFRLLSRNLYHNGFDGRSQLLPIALTSAAGEATIVVPRGEPKNALIGEVQDEEVDNGRFTRFTVPTAPIDDLDVPPLDFLKIDAEGAERQIWSGMQRTLDRSPRIQIVMEVNCQRYPDAADFVASIEDRYPLQAVGVDGAPHPVRAEDVLAATSDTMLYLTRPA